MTMTMTLRNVSTQVNATMQTANTITKRFKMLTVN